MLHKVTIKHCFPFHNLLVEFALPECELERWQEVENATRTLLGLDKEYYRILWNATVFLYNYGILRNFSSFFLDKFEGC